MHFMCFWCIRIHFVFIHSWVHASLTAFLNISLYFQLVAFRDISAFQTHFDKCIHSSCGGMHSAAFDFIYLLFHSVFVTFNFMYVSFCTHFIHRPLHSTTPPHSSAFQAVFILTLSHLHHIFFILKRLHPRYAPFSKDHLTLVTFKCILVHTVSVAFAMWCICTHSWRMVRCAAF